MALGYEIQQSPISQLTFVFVLLLPREPLPLIFEGGVVLHASHGGVLPHEVRLGRAVLEQVEPAQVLAEVLLLGAAIQDLGQSYGLREVGRRKWVWWHQSGRKREERNI